MLGVWCRFRSLEEKHWENRTPQDCYARLTRPVVVASVADRHSSGEALTRDRSPLQWRFVCQLAAVRERHAPPLRESVAVRFEAEKYLQLELESVADRLSVIPAPQYK